MTDAKFFCQIHNDESSLDLNSFHGQALQTINISRDANFPDAEIVRSKMRGGHGPCAGPGGVQEQRHLGGPGEICYRSDIQKILQKKTKTLSD